MIKKYSFYILVAMLCFSCSKDINLRSLIHSSAVSVPHSPHQDNGPIQNGPTPPQNNPTPNYDPSTSQRLSVDFSKVHLKSLKNLGLWIDARENNSYGVLGGSFIKDQSNNFHISFAGSGEPYNPVKEIDWHLSSYDKSTVKYTTDIGLTSKLETNGNPQALEELKYGSLRWNQAQKAIYPASYSNPDYPNLKEIFSQGGCSNTKVKFGNYYYTFFEHYIENPDDRPFSMSLGIYVARSLNIDDNYQVWTENGWRTIPTSEHWKPIIRPLIIRTPEGFNYMKELGKRSSNPMGSDYWGAGMPNALIKDNRIYLFYLDVTYQMKPLNDYKTTQKTLPYGYLIKSKFLYEASDDLLNNHFDQMFVEGSETPTCTINHNSDGAAANWWPNVEDDPCEKIAEGRILDTNWGVGAVVYLPENDEFIYLELRAKSYWVDQEIGAPNYSPGELNLYRSKDGLIWEPPITLTALSGKYGSFQKLVILTDEYGHANLDELFILVNKYYDHRFVVDHWDFKGNDIWGFKLTLDFCGTQTSDPNNSWDVNNDGKIDVIDSDNDGRADTFDVNADGKMDQWDLNGDGKIDAWDVNSDGIADQWDLNGDGKIDAWDINSDGKPDLWDLNWDGIIDTWDSTGNNDGVPG